MSCVCVNVNMAYVHILLLIGFISIASGQMRSGAGGSGALGQNEIVYVDPFMRQKCESRGIQFEDLNEDKASCIQQAAQNYIQSGGGLNNRLEAITVVCKIRDAIDSCLDTFINEVKDCYSTEAEKKEVEHSKIVANAAFDYMCMDDAQQMKDVFSKTENMMCISSIAGGADDCMTETLEQVNPSTTSLQNEETCLASFKIGTCLFKPMKNCDSSAPYNFFAGLFNATMDASKCRKYRIPRPSEISRTSPTVVSIVSEQKEGHTGSHAAGHAAMNQNEIIFIDPFMAQKCEAKGIQFDDLYQEKQTCFQEAAKSYIENMGGLSNPSDAITVRCRIGYFINSCVEKFMNGIKQCYDTNVQKKEVDNFADVFNAAFKYMCKEDAKEIKDLFNNSMLCLAKMEKGADKCLDEGLSDVKPSTTHLQNEQTCLAAFEIGKCFIEPLQDCDSSKPYEYLRGLMNTTLAASECHKYIDSRPTAAAGTPTSANWIIQSMLFVVFVFMV